jgi:NADH-quinone oxidoreductase subunit L
MFRLMFLTFHGRARMSHDVEHHIHESPRSMTVPLIILAFFSVFAGFLGWPHSLGGSDRFGEFLKPVFAPETRVMEEQGRAAQVAAGETETEHTSPVEYTLMLLSLGLAVGGGLLAYRAYWNADRGYREPIAIASPPLYRVLYNKYFVDEGYDYLFTGRRKLGPVRLGVMGLGEACSTFDRNVIDGAVNGAGWSTRVVGTLSNLWDKWIIDGLFVKGVAIFFRTLSWPMRVIQWGLVQWYALVMTAGLVGFLAWYIVK